MIDIHPAPHVAKTWQEFLVHIATIVIGLLIAVGIDQGVELVHHRRERRELIEALRAEAEKRIPRSEANMEAYSVRESWNRGCLQAALSAKPSDGYVTFVLPSRPQDRLTQRPEDAVWPAAKASGQVAVLSAEETQAWGRVDYYANRVDALKESYETALTAAQATADHLGSSFTPGASMHITLAERDEFTRILGTVIETEQAFVQAHARWTGTSEAVLHGANTLDAMQPYLDHALQTTPY